MAIVMCWGRFHDELGQRALGAKGQRGKGRGHRPKRAGTRTGQRCARGAQATPTGWRAAHCLVPHSPNAVTSETRCNHTDLTVPARIFINCSMQLSRLVPAVPRAPQLLPTTTALHAGSVPRPSKPPKPQPKGKRPGWDDNWAAPVEHAVAPSPDEVRRPGDGGRGQCSARLGAQSPKRSSSALPMLQCRQSKLHKGAQGIPHVPSLLCCTGAISNNPQCYVLHLSSSLY